MNTFEVKIKFEISSTENLHKNKAYIIELLRQFNAIVDKEVSRPHIMLLKQCSISLDLLPEVTQPTKPINQTTN